MEKKLRYKFVGITMGVVFTILFIIGLGFNLTIYLNVDEKADIIIQLMEENGGALPNDVGQTLEEYGESAFATRYFTVTYTQDGILVDLSNFSSINAEEAIALADRLEDSSGFVGSYKYKITTNNGNTMVIFVDCSSELLFFQTTLNNSIYIGVIALFGVFLSALIFSKKAVDPFVKNNASQKQFITDISHELKTPLAVIKANTELIEMTNGSSEWSEDIHKQIDGLNDLVLYLIKLSKMEETHKINKEKFNLSEMLNESCDHIKVLSEHRLIKDIKDDIFCFGDNYLFKILISILLENSIKYTTGDITVALNGKCLMVSNQCDNVPAGKYDKWFQRFYKEDDSHNRNGSFGIGLSMAKSIVDKHNAKIIAYSDGKMVVFKVFF